MPSKKFQSVELTKAELNAISKSIASYRAREFKRVVADEYKVDLLNASAAAAIVNTTAAERRYARELISSQAPKVEKWVRGFRPSRRKPVKGHNPTRFRPYDFEWQEEYKRAACVIEHHGPDRIAGTIGDLLFTPYAGRGTVHTSLGFSMVAWGFGQMRFAADYTIAGRSIALAAGVGWAATSAQINLTVSKEGEPSDQARARTTVVDRWGSAQARYDETSEMGSQIEVTRHVERWTRYNVWVDLYQKVSAVGAGVAGSFLGMMLHSVQFDMQR